MNTTKKHVPKPPGRPNAKPMISKYVAPGIRELLDAVDVERVADNYPAQRALEYMLNLARYLESPAYEAKSKRQSQVTKQWRNQRAAIRESAVGVDEAR